MLSFSSRTRLVPSGNHRSSSRTLVVVARSQQPLSTMTTPIQEYIDKHGLQKKVEDVLNACVQAKPADPLPSPGTPPGAPQQGQPEDQR